MTIKPLHDYVLVEAQEKQVSKVIHVAGDTKSDTGIVVAAGPEADFVQAGDEVIFAQDIIREEKQDDGTVQYWMKAINVMGILREK